MSSTRHAEPGGPLRPERWASSPEYERGLPAHLVAKRLSKVNDPAIREAMLYVQHRSWDGGLHSLVGELLAGPVPVGTCGMAAIGAEPGRTYTSEEARQAREGMPERKRERFILAGELTLVERLALAEQVDPRLSEAQRVDDLNGATGRFVEGIRAASAGRPASYAAGEFVDLCRQEAGYNLADWLAAYCMDPAQPPTVGPWYFSRCVEALLVNCQAFQNRVRAKRAVTSNGTRIREALEYVANAPWTPDAARPLALLYGGSGLGKSFEAKAMSDERPGRFRYVQVPVGNDDHSFFLEINRVLGALQNTRAKALELRERCEAVLETGDIVLVLDDAHRLWIQTNLRDNTPKRVEWVLQMADRGVPIVLVACPQFFDSQGLAEDKVKWNTLQVDRRIGIVPQLQPPTVEDLRAVAEGLMPTASTKACRAVATVAANAPGPLGTVAAIARRALHLAGAAEAVQDTHVRAAIKFALETNAALARAISARRSKAGRRREVGQIDAPSAPPAGLPPTHRGRAAAPDLTGESPVAVQFDPPVRQVRPSAAPALGTTG